MTDLLILAALAAAMTFLVAVVTTVPPGAVERYARGRRYHRSGRARHAAGTTTPAPAVETVPDVPASPFAARTA